MALCILDLGITTPTPSPSNTRCPLESGTQVAPLHTFSAKSKHQNIFICPLFFKKQDMQKLYFRTFATTFSLHLFEKRCPFARFLKKAGRAKTLFSHLRNPIFFAPFRKKVPKTFQPKLRFGEFDDVRVFVLVAGLILSRGFIAFYCEGLVVCDNNTKRK